MSRFGTKKLQSRLRLSVHPIPRGVLSLELVYLPLS